MPRGHDPQLHHEVAIASRDVSDHQVGIFDRLPDFWMDDAGTCDVGCPFAVDFDLLVGRPEQHRRPAQVRRCHRKSRLAGMDKSRTEKGGSC